MTELSLYTFLESIVDVIPTIQNRFLVVEGGVGDLNADNSDDAIIGNSVNQTDWKKKYPCAVLMPPREVGRNKQKLTTRFQLTMYFLTTTYADGMNATKSINVQTNTSKVSIKEDWSQMKSVAEDFMATMNNQFYTDLTILDYIRPVKSNEETYDRVTMVNNDRLSGIRLTFELDVVIGCSAGSGNDPEWTPPVSNPSCGVCTPGEVGQVWTTINDNTVGWQTPSGGGGASQWGGISGTLTDQLDLKAALDAKQPLDSDLTTIAGLTPANDDIIQRKAGSWINRTLAQLAADIGLSNYFNKISDDTDDITVGATNKFATAAEKTKLGFISVTQAVDLDTIESDTATNNAKVTNATHTGEVTGSGVLTVDKTAISNRTAVSADSADYILIGDSSDSGNLKKGIDILTPCKWCRRSQHSFQRGHGWRWCVQAENGS